jgi:MoaA/NifB/PqqE/SkfB family radical SAM enzyme
MQKTVSFSKDASNLFFHILTTCNLFCKHCYINQAQHGSRMLPLEVAGEWLFLFAQRHPKTNLILLGGEPTLHPDLDKIILKAHHLAYNSITVDTNGYLFYDIIEKVAPELVDYFSFSLDGASANTNDRIRGKGSFVRCLEGIRKTVAKGFATSLIFTVSRANILDLEKMVPLLVELGIKRFFIQVLGIRGNSAKTAGADSDPAKQQITRSEWLSTIPRVAQAAAANGIRVTYPKVFLENDEVFECAGQVADNYFVFPNGRVYRCPLCEDYPIHSLKIEDNELMERPAINEKDLFPLAIAEGCVMNKIIQSENLSYDANLHPQYKIACCMLKEEVYPAGPLTH